MFTLFFWKKNKLIDDFAINLADDLYSQIQPEVMNTYLSDKKSKSAKKINRQLEDIIHRVKQFRATYSLGVYGKARLHLNFTERLKELGYEKKLAEKINEMILLKTP